MIATSRAAAVRRQVAAWRRSGREIVFVPTMGALHDGHRRLVEKATGPGRRAVVSLFVNPRQFGPNEDYGAYPRALAADKRICREAGAALVWTPSVADMYPDGFATTVHVAGLDRTLCGPFRPGHFDGVTTVVLKLLNVVQPDRLLLGQKDAQQAAIVGRMIADLDLPVGLTVVPTVREKDGLAMSSRNRYLTDEERRAAPALYAALSAGAALVRRGERRSAVVLAAVRERLTAEPLFRPQYLELVDGATLQPVERLERPALLAAAAFLGRARLIDNIPLRIAPSVRRPRRLKGDSS
jgi:pantoate--beta-alanine ligase